MRVGAIGAVQASREPHTDLERASYRSHAISEPISRDLRNDLARSADGSRAVCRPISRDVRADLAQMGTQTSLNGDTGLPKWGHGPSQMRARAFPNGGRLWSSDHSRVLRTSSRTISGPIPRDLARVHKASVSQSKGEGPKRAKRDRGGDRLYTSKADRLPRHARWAEVGPGICAAMGGEVLVHLVGRGWVGAFRREWPRVARGAPP